MKEYKVINTKFSFRNGLKKHEDNINNYAKQGWVVISTYVISNIVYFVLERDKNR